MSTTKNALLLYCAAAVAAACVEPVPARPDRADDATTADRASSDGSSNPDATTPPMDSSTTPDGSSMPDATTPPMDAAMDSGVVVDTGVVSDSGVVVDSGVPVDTGVVVDSGVPVDTGVMACSTGLTSCGGSCVDLQSDPRFCGSCMRACGATQVCAAGSCQDRVSGLVLSELRAQSTPFVELYNGGNAAVDLNGYLLQWSVDTGTSGSVTLPAYSLPAGQFVTITTGTGTAPASTVYVASAPVWTQRIAVRLLTPASVGQDFVRTADSSVAPPAGTMWMGVGAANPARDLNQSLVRNVYAPDTDSAADWSLQSLSSPGAYCARNGRCGAVCVDQDNDPRNCGGCGVTCGATQVCRGGACAPGAGNLWISEYRRSPRAVVEIHNPTARAINVRDYRLQVASGGTTRLNFFLPDRTLAPGAYLAIYEGAGTADATTVYAGMTGVFQANSTITLFDSGTGALDFVPFGSGSTMAPMGTSWFGATVTDPDANANSAARRNIAGLDSDSNADWTVDLSPATPGYACVSGLSLCGARCVDTNVNPSHCGACGRACSANATCIAGTCRATDAVRLSRLKNNGVEEIELHNGSNAPVDISGWIVSWVGDGGSGDFTFPMGVTLMPNQYVTVVEGMGSASGGRYPAGRTIDWTTFIAVSLRNSTMNGVDFVRTAGSPTMPPMGTSWTGANATNPSDSSNESLVRNVWTADTDTAADWRIVASVSGPGLCGATPVCGGACVNTNTDVTNCGACGNVCPVGNRCVLGRCFEGGAPPTMDWDVRLSGGSSGVLEVYYSGQWRGVCDDGGNFPQLAQVVCRQLGFSGGSAACCAAGSSAFWLDDVICSGAEANLNACGHSAIGTHNCVSGENISVTCM